MGSVVATHAARPGRDGISKPSPPRRAGKATIKTRVPEPASRAKGRQGNIRACRSSQPPSSSRAYIADMSHTHAWVLTHCVFSTQGRLALIPDVSEMCKYLTGIARAKGITLLAAGGTANHIHLLIALPPTVALSKVMQDFQGNSSHWQNKRGKKFAWHEGF